MNINFGLEPFESYFASDLPVAPAVGLEEENPPASVENSTSWESAEALLGVVAGAARSQAARIVIPRTAVQVAQTAWGEAALLEGGLVEGGVVATEGAAGLSVGTVALIAAGVAFTLAEAYLVYQLTEPLREGAKNFIFEEIVEPNLEGADPVEFNEDEVRRLVERWEREGIYIATPFQTDEALQSLARQKILEQKMAAIQE